MDKAEGSAWSTLKEPGFSSYWLAGLTANFGWQVQLVAASWLMISLGASPQLVALVQASVSLPVMLLSLPGGAISDTIGQRAVVLWSQVFLVIVSAVLAACTYFGIITPGLLLTCTFLVGCGRAIYYPGWQSMVLELVPRNSVSNAVALNSSNLNIARSVGPAVGGAIVALAGAPLAFLVNAFSNLSVFLIAKRWPRATASSHLPNETFSSAIVAGVRYVLLTPELLNITIRSTIFNFCAISALALMPLIARDMLGGGAQTFGLLLGSFGLGAVAGAFAIAAARRAMALEVLVTASNAAFAICLAVLGLTSNIAFALLASTIAGICWTFVQVTLNSAIQTSSPRWVLSRSNAVYQTMIFGGNALGSMLWGALAGWPGLSAALIVPASLMGLGVLLTPLFRIQERSGAALDHSPYRISPEPSLALAQHDGPIIATLHYRIDNVDIPAFLAAMAMKRRNRLRDGATRWSLTRDIHDPDLWFERYRVPTWADAQRLHNRRTQESAELSEFLRSLHRDEDKPEVHYTLLHQTNAPRETGPAFLP